MSEFGTLNLEDIQADDTRLNSDKQENFLDQFIVIPDPKPGQTITFALRLLPPRKGSKLFQYTRLHLMNGRKYQCPRPLVNGKWDYKTACPACDYYNSLYRQIDKLKKSGREAEWKKLEQEARSIKPIERYYYNAIARVVHTEEGKELNAGPKVFSCGKVLHKIIVKGILGGENEPALGDVTNVKTGFDFLVKKEMRGSGSDSYPNYDRSSFARDCSPAGTAEEVQKWVEGLHDLTTNRKPTEFDILDKQLAIHRGLIPDEKDGFDVEEFDNRWKGNGTQVKKPAKTVVAHTEEDVNKVVKPVSEDQQLTDPEFFADLERMQNEMENN